MNDELYNKIYLAIEKKGKTKNFRISYAMKNPLEEVLTSGMVKIIMEDMYESPILNSPTYLDIVVAANDMINKYGVVDHIYLEDVNFAKQQGNFKLYNCFFGS